jgi:hypothetical protein
VQAGWRGYPRTDDQPTQSVAFRTEVHNIGALATRVVEVIVTREQALDTTNRRVEGHAMQGLALTIAALVLSVGLAWAQCPTGLSGGATYVVDLRGVLTLTACDQTWMSGVASGRQVRIAVGSMTVVTEPGDQLQLRGGGISVKPPGIPIPR